MKKWYQSRTIWINLISLGIEVGNMLMVNPIIPVRFAGVLTIIVNIANIVLRTLTTTTIAK